MADNMRLGPPARTYVFVDGGFLREMAKAAGHKWYDPARLARKILGYGTLDWFSGAVPRLSRTLYFDAERDEVEPKSPDHEELEKYWRAVELLPDTHLAFGWVRGKASKQRQKQKAVDTLLAVEMVSGAYTRRFDLAILVAGDADYVPIVNEVRRAGPHVVVAAGIDKSNPSGKPRFAYSDELRRAADRFIEFPLDPTSAEYKSLFSELPVGP